MGGGVRKTRREQGGAADTEAGVFAARRSTRPPATSSRLRPPLAIVRLLRLLHNKEGFPRCLFSALPRRRDDPTFHNEGLVTPPRDRKLSERRLGTLPSVFEVLVCFAAIHSHRINLEKFSEPLNSATGCSVLSTLSWMMPF